MTSQYRTIEQHAVWADVSARGRLRFEGSDAPAFLHALVTNDVAGLLSGRGVYAAWLTPQGRMITDLRLLRDAAAVLAEVPEGLAADLRTRFDQLLFSEDVQVSDITDSTRAWLAVGGTAAAAVAEVTGADASAVAALPPLGHMTCGGARIIRMDEAALPTFEVWTEGMSWTEKMSGLLTPDASSAIDALRIEAGRPKFGVDMTTETIPLEAGLLDRAISQSKGCYVGQEVIVRILHRGGGKVVKHLMRLAFDPGARTVPPAGTELLQDGKTIGSVTSAAIGLLSGQVIALGYVHRDAAVVGNVVHTAVGAAATITAFAG
jgi:folate-binding protein YgfZ